VCKYKYTAHVWVTVLDGVVRRYQD